MIAMSSKMWMNDNWVASPVNFEPSVTKQFEFPRDIQIHDVTCRDGEQRPGVVFRKDDKVKIAMKLGEFGAQRIEAGLPAVSDEDFAAVKEIAHLGLSSKVYAFSRARKDDVDLALKCDVPCILIESPSSDDLIKTGFDWNKNKVLELVAESTQYAKSHGLYTTYFAVDSTRADPRFLKELYTTAVKESHVDSIAVVDTFGVASPQGVAEMVRTARKWVDVPIEVHCHNDFGLGTANALAGLAAGASVAHTNVNGLGERAGGASTEEVAIALRVLYGKDLGFKYDKIYDLSKLVQEISGVRVSPQKPVVGDTAFGYEAGIAVMFCYRYKHAKMMKYALPYMPEIVGNKFSIDVGKKSGAFSIRWRLEEMGYEATDEQVEAILARVKQRAFEKKWALSHEEFAAIYDDVVQRRK